MSEQSHIDTIKDSVFQKSKISLEDKKAVKGYDFDNGRDFDALLNSYKNMGFQATEFGKAIDEITKMVYDYMNIILYLFV